MRDIDRLFELIENVKLEKIGATWPARRHETEERHLVADDWVIEFTLRSETKIEANVCGILGGDPIHAKLKPIHFPHHRQTFDAL
jgi:hypothetical protein